MKRKLFAIITSVLLLCAMLPMSAMGVSAATSGTTGDCTWTLEGTYLTISGNGAMADYDYWDNSAPWGRSLTSVTIEDGVTTIGEVAFYNCDSLASVTIPDSVTAIGSGAFRDCVSLTSVTIPDSVTTIGICAFDSCTALDSVTLGDSVTTIEDNAFWGCSSLWRISIPSSVTFIGSSAFLSCDSLIFIDVNWDNPNYSSSSGVLFDKEKTTLIQYPGGKSDRHYTVPYSVTTIGVYAFGGNRFLTSVTIPNNVTTIEDLAFGYCDSLKSVILPDSITSIAYGMFYKCPSLSSVFISDSVTTIDINVFANCPSLTVIDVDENNPNYSSLDGVLFNKDQTTLIQYPSGKTGAYTIPNSVTAIEEDAFQDCACLTSVTIPDSVTTIGNYAFFYCSSLTDVYYTGSEQERAAMSIGSSNTGLTNATWHYNCINPKDNYTKPISHSVMDTTNGNGLAFRFELLADGVKMVKRTEADLTAATVNYLGTDCKLVGMGAVITNNAAVGETKFTHADVNDLNVVDIPVVYLQEANEDSCAFATRIIDIPDTQLERILYARPYYVVEVDGEEIVVYGDVDSATCAAYM